MNIENEESLEEKVERLEYYIHLLREFIVDQETFILWDWVISHRLNREQVRSIIDLCKHYNQRLDEEGTDILPSLDELVNDIQKIMTPIPDLDFTVNKNLVLQMLKRISNMNLFNRFTSHYLQQE